MSATVYLPRRQRTDLWRPHCLRGCFDCSYLKLPASHILTRILTQHSGLSKPPSYPYQEGALLVQLLRQNTPRLRVKPKFRHTRELLAALSGSTSLPRQVDEDCGAYTYLERKRAVTCHSPYIGLFLAGLLCWNREASDHNYADSCKS